MHIEQRPGYILHSRPYRETSQLIEAFTLEHGRVGLIARGVRRERSRIPRALLQPFQSLRLSWTGHGDLPTLTMIEAWDNPLTFRGTSLFCALYTNELVLRLSARNDPHSEVYVAYETCLKCLSAGMEIAWTLRRFERDLLHSLGYGLVLDHEPDTGQVIDPSVDYSYHAEHGPQLWHIGSSGPRIKGSDLLTLHNDCAPDTASLQRLKYLMRSIILYHLGGKELQSWKMLQDFFQTVKRERPIVTTVRNRC